MLRAISRLGRVSHLANSSVQPSIGISSFSPLLASCARSSVVTSSTMIGIRSASYAPLSSCLRPSQRLGGLLKPGCPGVVHVRTASKVVLANANAKPAAGKAQKKGKNKEDDSVYKTTVRLPQTTFDLRANSKTREPELQKWWQEKKIYERLASENPGEEFILHDGPPYANGDLHIGHALNKILKDIINRYQMLNGRKVRYVPGWDCHGLPIELKVLQGMDAQSRSALTPISLRTKAKEFALKAVDAQREQFKRYGIWGAWEQPYMTMQPEYEAAQVGVFGRMFLNGHIYRGLKPVNWSPSSQTALAEAELEYPEGHTSRSVYVTMPLTAPPPGASAELQAALSGAALAIWTTTPWTIPGNCAVALNGDLDYVVAKIGGEPAGKAKVPTNAKTIIVAKGLLESLQAKWGLALEVVLEAKGAQLEGAKYRHPLIGRESPVVMGGDYITTESGTGLVHTAPGHGQEDYLTGMKYGLPLLSPVDGDGKFTAEAGEEFSGKSVLSDGTEAVIKALEREGCLVLEEAYKHKYPYDWRTKQPTIFRATEQWFASVEGFREAALGAVGTVTWVPAVGEKRITPMVAGRNDWCISRQRTWGLPIPAFFDKATGEVLMDADTIAHVQGVFAKHGSDAWWTLELPELLPEKYRSRADSLRKGTDTMDVWFDSGSSWAGVVDTRKDLRWPADLYLEGSDQHRGWFQSSLLTSVAARGKAPYKQVLTHGFVLDEKGFKMSKSLGNVVDPRLVIDGGKDEKLQPAYGADVLRLWVSSVDYTSDVLIGPAILKQTSEQYRKLRGTLRFLLGNLDDFDPARDAVPYAQLPEVDRFALSRLAELMAEVRGGYESFQFARAFQAINTFTAAFLSNFYLDTAKDRLYIRAGDARGRRACQTVLHAVLGSMQSAIAPVMPHMAEDCFQANPKALKPAGADSVFQLRWSEPAKEWGALPAAEVAFWESVLLLRGEVNKVIEAARVDKVVGANLDAKVLLHVAEGPFRERLGAFADKAADTDGVDELRFLFLVSEVELVGSAEAAKAAAYSGGAAVDGAGEVTVGVSKAPGAKCDRCWNFGQLVGRDKAHPLLCQRCVPVVVGLGMAAAPAAPASAPAEPAAAA